MRPARLYAAGVQCIATSLCFFLSAVVKLPMVLYFPLSRRWSLTANPAELSMDFYGRSLLALGSGAVAGLVTLAAFWLYYRLRGDGVGGDPAEAAARRENGLALLGGYVVTALLLAMGVYAYELYGRAPVPEPLPAGLRSAPLASPARASPVSPASPLSPASTDPPE